MLVSTRQQRNGSGMRPFYGLCAPRPGTRRTAEWQSPTTGGPHGAVCCNVLFGRPKGVRVMVSHAAGNHSSWFRRYCRSYWGRGSMSLTIRKQQGTRGLSFGRLARHTRSGFDADGKGSWSNSLVFVGPAAGERRQNGAMLLGGNRGRWIVGIEQGPAALRTASSPSTE